jgi:cell division ATPase FtsA
MKDVSQLFNYQLGLEVHLGSPGQHLGKGLIDEVRNPMYSTAIGLVMMGFDSSEKVGTEFEPNVKINKTETNQTKANLEEVIIQEPEAPKKEKSERVSNHSDYTKQLISQRLKTSLNDDTHREKMMKLSQNQHSNQKFEKFKNVTVDENNIDQYIHVINSEKMGTYIRIIINRIRTTFVGKYETIDMITNRARIFILNLLKWQRDQIAGNSLEPSLPLTDGNISEELG